MNWKYTVITFRHIYFLVEAAGGYAFKAAGLTLYFVFSPLSNSKTNEGICCDPALQLQERLRVQKAREEALLKDVLSAIDKNLSLRPNTNDDDDDDFITLYRGVGEYTNPNIVYQYARSGIAIPKGNLMDDNYPFLGHSNTFDHTMGDNSSIFTSWTY